MISVIYAMISAILIIRLSLNVIKQRYINRVSIGNGGVEELEVAMAAQSNAVEYIPIALLLLFALEYNGASIIIVHILGLSLLTGRIIHARAMQEKSLKARILGMRITIYTIIGLVIANLIYLPYGKLLKL